MKRIIAILLLVVTLVGCKQPYISSISDEVISDTCRQAIENVYTYEEIKPTVVITSRDFLCSGTSNAAKEYKVICKFNITFESTVIEDNTALVALIFDESANKLLSREVRLNA